MEAHHWVPEGDGVRCTLCFHRCYLTRGARGLCGARKEEGGRLVSPFLGRFPSVAVDPIEKKPLYHWRPGSRILSLGGLGCNLDCPFCQNDSLSHPLGWIASPFLEPEELVALAEAGGEGAVAFTYNEPLIHPEYLLEAGRQLHRRGIRVVWITNGTIEPEPLEEILGEVDAANVDLKAFTQEGYRSLGGDLESVLRTLRRMREAGVHLEVTHLVVPGLNDDPTDFSGLVDWLADLSPRIPLHLSRYFPRRKATAPATSLRTLEGFRDIAEKRLKHVYLGNCGGSAVTRCEKCGRDILARSEYNIFQRHIAASGNCGFCGQDNGIVP